MFTGQEEVVVSVLCLCVLCAVCWSMAKTESVARKFSGFGSFLLFPLKTPVPFLGESSQMEY